MSPNKKIYRITVTTQDIHAFLAQCEAAEWSGFDTGERIMTDAGPDAEAVLMIETAPRAIEPAGVPLLQ